MSVFLRVLPDAFYKFTPIKNQLSANLLCPLLSCRHYQIHILNDCKSGPARIAMRWAGCWERTRTTSHPLSMESGDRLRFCLREQDEQVLNTEHISPVSAKLLLPDFLSNCRFSF